MTRPTTAPPGAERIDTAALLARVDLVRVIEDAGIALRRAGAEFEACCPFHTEATPSFKVSPAKQFYHCFGCGAHGDAIGFLQAYRGLSFVDACQALGADAPAAPAPPPPPRAGKAKAARSAWLPLLPVPADAPAPPAAHPHRGLPEARWCYRDLDGQVLGWVYRFRTSDGGKEVLPLVWAQAPGGAPAWRWLSMPEPRPLYGLDRLAAKPAATVLIVEGEKCADAAAAELPDLAVLSWPGGGKAVQKADWRPLAGRKVITWADADAKREPLVRAEKQALEAACTSPEEAAAAIAAAQAARPLLPADEQPGVKAMVAVRARLYELGCRVWDVTLPAPGEQPDGWDVADAIAGGTVGAELAQWLRARLVSTTAPGALDPITAAALPTPEPASAGPERFDDGYDENIWRLALLRRDGKLVDCRENVFLMLCHHPALRGVVWADEFARRIVLRHTPPWESAARFIPNREWDQTDSMRLGLWLAQQERLLVKAAANLEMAVAWAAAESRWHPVREYLDGLVWDQTKRNHCWLSDYLGVRHSEYAMRVGQFWLRGMVARIYRPGCQMRFVPILEGQQYRGKSLALRTLAQPWFSDAALDLASKDAYLLIQGSWLHELGELDAFGRAESTRIKLFVAQQTDRFRAPYERAPREYARQGIFAGSTNPTEYLKDKTGNTRFWPVRVEEDDDMRIDALAGARDQLFAEAVADFRAGERWHPNADEQERLFEPQQADREIIDPWEQAIRRYLAETTAARVTTLQILGDALKVEVAKIDRGNLMARDVGAIMARLGWAKQREPSGAREWFYVRPAPAGVRAAAVQQVARPGPPESDHVPF